MAEPEKTETGISRESKYQQAPTVSTVAEQPPAYGKPEKKSETPMASKSETPAAQKQKAAKPVQQSLFEPGRLAEQKIKELRIVGQLFSTYWIMEYDDKMYLVDQHAAHEKVLYERFIKQIQKKKPMTQILKPPLLFTMSMSEQEIFQEHKDIFTELGFLIEAFGDREYAVSEIPVHLPSISALDLLTDALDMLSDHHSNKTPEIIFERIASMSCKAAVKGNQKMEIRQAEELIREMMDLENPYHCPHGRPTMISMSRRELDKKFKRIL